MATHKSAEKRARQSIKRNQRNTEAVRAVRTSEKKVRTAVEGGNKTAAKTLLNDYMSKMAKAATKGVFTKQMAARKIGRLAVTVSKMAGK